MSTLAADYGVRQFLEIGTGLPTADNTHEVAQQVAPTSRIVYVDNDPAVLSHARAADQRPRGQDRLLEADLRDPGAIPSAADQAVAGAGGRGRWHLAGRLRRRWQEARPLVACPKSRDNLRPGSVVIRNFPKVAL